MEKDYFKDRPYEVTDINHIKQFIDVYICTKDMQKSASTIQHLTKGTVIRVLTKHNHPRGIKVEILKDDCTTAIGRCVYIIKDDLLLTKYGLKKEDEVNKM